MRRVVLVGALLAGCGRLEFTPMTDAGSGAVADGARDGSVTPLVCGPWTSVMAVPGTTRPSNTRSGTIAPDGLSIAWVDDVGGAIAYYQTRTARDQAFGAAQAIPSLPAGIWDVGAILDGGRTLIYSTTVANGCPVAITGPQPYAFGGSAVPLSPGCGATFLGASLTSSGLALYATDTTENPRFARRASTATGFSTFMDISEFPDPVNYPAVREDELELYFENAAGGSNDLWVAKRASTSDPWGTPELVALVNGPGQEEDVSITADGTELYFDSDRSGVFNLYVATRTCN